MEASTAAMTVVGILIKGVLRLYRFAARPATSKHTPPPMAMIGSLRLEQGHSQYCNINLMQSNTTCKQQMDVWTHVLKWQTA